MKVEITDEGVFSKLSPKNLRNYLSSKDWQCIKQIENTFSIWDTQAEEQKYRVWLPEDTELGDFSLAMARTIKTLAIFESRSQLDLLEDIDTLAIGDVVRVRTFDPLNSGSNSLPFDYGLALIQRAKNLVIAGACATLEKKALFSAKKHSQVSDYSKTLRLGQTERGSFITKIISPIKLENQSNNVELFDVVPNIPFERQSIVTMLEGLDALHCVANETSRRGSFSFEPFEEVVSHGVSVLLCEAVAGDITAHGYQQTEIDVSWFYNELINKPLINKTHLSFDSRMMGFIKEAAKRFRETEPENLEIEGYIIKLDREKQQGDGVVTILQVDDFGMKKRFKVKLCEQDYNSATEAHKEGCLINCSGSVEKEGRSSFISYPNNFRVIEE